MRPVVLLALVACCSCTAVLGLDERERASVDSEVIDTSFDTESADSLDEDSTSDSGDASVQSDTTTPGDTSKDTATPPDTFVPMDTAKDTLPPPTDTTPVDSSTAPCAFFGLSCPTGQSCVVTLTGTTYSVACATSPAPSPTGACTGVAELKCPTGRACRTGYAFTKCAPLCTSAAMCDAPYVVCSPVTWSGSTTSTGVCDVCDPVANTGCGSMLRCGVGSADAPPTCRKFSDFGGRDAGQTCPTGNNCSVGNVCACAGGFGIDSCPSGGTCVKLCVTNADCVGAGTTGTTCKSPGGATPYKGCLP